MDGGPFAVRRRAAPEIIDDRESLIRFEGARWLRLELEGCAGAEGHVRIRSPAGAAESWRPATAMIGGRHSSFFNTDRLFVRFIGPRSDRRLCRVSAVESSSGMLASTPVGAGLSETRTQVSDRRLIRLLVQRNRGRWFVCSAWLHRSGWYVSAGHCARGLQAAHRSAPLSLTDGELQFPAPADQAQIDRRSILYDVAGPGQDWAVFRLFWPAPDSETTSVTESDAPGFAVVAEVSAQRAIQVSGFGGDLNAGGQAPGPAHHTLRRASGELRGRCGRGIEYSGLFTEGMSGAPVVDAISGEVIAIHTHGLGVTGCGTPLDNETLQRALKRPL